MRNRILKLITCLLIVAGVLLWLYPLFSNWLVSRHQTTAIRHYGLTVADMNGQKKQEALQKAQTYNDLLNGVGIADPFLPGSGYVLPEEYLGVLNIDGVIGFIDIPKINVHVPIYHGTDEKTLKKGAGHLQNTAFPIGGEGSHCVLTGHSGLTSARLFTDLEKLEVGDTFSIAVLDEKRVYRIDQMLTVEPSDTRELMPVNGKDYVTLITCTPYGINSHRLFVRAERTAQGRQGGEARFVNNGIAGCLIAGPLLFMLARRLNRWKRRKSS